MEKYQTNKVFTPTSPAVFTFVERENRINNHLVDALDTPGKQIVLYGHSGCGKTTLIINKLSQTYENTVITRCMEGMTFENILLDGFDQLGKFYTESVKTKGFRIAPSVTFNYNEIKSTLSVGEISKLEQVSTKSILPPQLTAQRLAKFFGESKSCWVLEDFHKVKCSEKTKTSQLMKVFMDLSQEYPELKLIAIGAVGSARQVVEYDKEMYNRVAEIYIPYMKPEEIEVIINTGEKLLNLKFSKDVKNKILKYSYGLPSICHQLCLNICFERRIKETSKELSSINMTDLEKAIEKYVGEKSDSLKSEFDKAIKVPNDSVTNLPKSILIAALKINKDEFSYDEICFHLKVQKIKRQDVERTLSELCSVKRSEILIYDENSNLYRFNNLFLKAYTNLNFKDDYIPKPTHFTTNEKVIYRLIEIIENDIADDTNGFFIEDL